MKGEQEKISKNTKKEDSIIISVDLESNFLLYCAIFVFSRENIPYFS